MIVGDLPSLNININVVVTKFKHYQTKLATTQSTPIIIYMVIQNHDITESK